jgi:hypothetical protein
VDFDGESLPTSVTISVNKMEPEGSETNHDRLILLLLLIPSFEGSTLILRDNANARRGPLPLQETCHCLSGGQATT